MRTYIGERSRSKLQPEANVPPLPGRLLQGFRLNAIVSTPVYLRDQYTGGCQDWQLPFQIAGTNNASGTAFNPCPNCEASSRSRGKTRGYCNPDLWRHLVPVVVVDFPAPALRIRPCRSVVLRFASAQRMSRPSERMMSLGHELRRTDEQRTRKKPGSACDSVNPHDFQNSYQTQMHSQPQALGWIIVKTQNLMKTGFGGHQFRQPVA
jgi:hypothetical protein